MVILSLGDVVGSDAVFFLSQNLWRIRRENHIDFCTVNGENAADIHGISAEQAQTLLDAGADLITLGNHAFGNKSIFPILESTEKIIRPANYPPSAPGMGHTVLKINGYRILCMNVSGRVNMEPLNDPFETVEEILKQEKGNYDLSMLDIHAEATSEKMALARYFDGQIDLIYGTHTHVATADERILPNGTAYVTDLGMTGPVESIIGSDVATVIGRFRTGIPCRMTVAEGNVESTGIIFDSEKKTIRRIRF